MIREPRCGQEPLDCEEKYRAGPTKRRRKDEGFSLIELLVVLMIMALIAALVAPRLFNQVDKSRQTVAETQIRSLSSALDTMRLDIGRYPTNEEGLALLVRAPSDQDIASNWFGPYLEEDLPVDPWGAPYEYRPAASDAGGYARKPFIFTYGADGSAGGEGLDRDLGRVPES